MARLIDCSIPDVVSCELSQGFTGKLKFRLAYGWNAHHYTQDQIASVTPIDEDKYRSAGGAAAGAIIGGVLTGGIGLLAGAAIGGRRRQRAAFVVVFDDGHHVAFEEGKNAHVNALAQIVQTDKARAVIGQPQAMKLVGSETGSAPSISHAAPSDQPAPLAQRVAPPELPKKPPPYGMMAFWAIVIIVALVTWWGFREDDAGTGIFMALIMVVPLLGVGAIILIAQKVFHALRSR